MQSRQNERGRDRDSGDELEDRVIQITRTAKVVKGGRTFAFRAVLAVGDRKGKVGIGIGKAREVPEAIRKAREQAKAGMVPVPIVGTTIPHPIEMRKGAARVMLRPASPGTGVIAGGGVRPVVEVAGISDILTKSLGSNNRLNVTQATFQALQSLQDHRSEADARGVPAESLAPFWTREQDQS